MPRQTQPEPLSDQVCTLGDSGKPILLLIDRDRDQVTIDVRGSRQEGNEGRLATGIPAACSLRGVRMIKPAIQGDYGGLCGLYCIITPSDW